MAIIAMTTSSSMSVKPALVFADLLRFSLMSFSFPLLNKAEEMSFPVGRFFKCVFAMASHAALGASIALYAQAPGHYGPCAALGHAPLLHAKLS
jgi:hypothetical protein